MVLSPELSYALAGGSKFLLRVVPVFAAAVYAANLLGRMGWLSGLAWLAGPVMRLGRLSPACGPGFVTSVVSPTAGHALLADEDLHPYRPGVLELVAAGDPDDVDPAHRTPSRISSSAWRRSWGYSLVTSTRRRVAGCSKPSRTAWSH